MLIKKNFFFKFYSWVCWVVVACHGLSPIALSGGHSSLRCEGFSLQWLLLLQSTGSRAHWVSKCDAWTQLPHSTWNTQRPGIELTSSALAGGFSTTGPLGKSLNSVLISFMSMQLSSFPTPFTEETVFSSLYGLPSFVTHQLTVGVWDYFWTFCPVLLICISVFVPILYCFYDCSFID